MMLWLKTLAEMDSRVSAHVLFGKRPRDAENAISRPALEKERKLIEQAGPGCARRTECQEYNIPINSLVYDLWTYVFGFPARNMVRMEDK